MNTSADSAPIMFATKYWGAPAFVKVIPDGNNFDVHINEQHFALLSYNSKHVLADLERRLSDPEMLDEISRRIEAGVH
ncbi:hypothetical protein EOD41_03760 [Mucilaginibacter limnophilus]|uniref:Uncharacterized protein n=1 Tax=Mucilaginibacter limnophilus TaxID=1932778 RepID=A0A3S2VAU3_9SPHI|nr:hypothetical protein [Mucilaginibacter limnophilus]RVU03060.1 hypothetical protein EOD41_03760 [Mucilaginibacter limnophilus]